jgi:hypothetical protein
MTSRSFAPALIRRGWRAHGRSSLEKGGRAPAFVQPWKTEAGSQRVDTVDTALFNAYNALLLQGHDAVPDPDAPAAHHVGQHHVGCQPITDHSNLVRSSDPSLRVLAEVRQNLVATAWLLHGMRKYVEPGRLFNLGSKPAIHIVARRTGSIGHDKETAPWVGCSQRLKSSLLSLAIWPDSLVVWRARQNRVVAASIHGQNHTTEAKKQIQRTVGQKQGE